MAPNQYDSVEGLRWSLRLEKPNHQHDDNDGSHARRADADEHLDKLGTGDREERHAYLACHRFREQRLAGAGRPDQEDAFGDAGAEPAALSLRKETISMSSAFA